MKILSSLGFATCTAAVLVAGCGSVADDRRSSASASGSGGGGGALATSSGVAMSSSTGSPPAPCPAAAWSHAYASSAGDAVGYGVAVDAACNVYFAGSFKGTLDLGSGSMGSPGQSLFVAKLDPNGQALWSHSYAVGAGASASTINVDPLGGIVFVGQASNGIDFGDGCAPSAQGTTQLFVARLDTSGNSLFCRGFVSKGEWPSELRALATNAKGDIVISGALGGKVDFGSGPISSGVFDRTSFLLALDPAGKLRWVLPMSNKTDFSSVNALDLSPDSVVHAGGHFDGSLDLGPGFGLTSKGGGDAFVTEISADGKPTWARSLGGAGGNDAVSVMGRGIGGDLIIGGFAEGTLDLGEGTLPGKGDANVFIARIDAAGKAQGGRLYGGPLVQFLTGMAVTEAGGLLLTGKYEGTIDFGGGALPQAPEGTYHAFAAKLDPEGKQIWSRGVTGPDPGLYGVALDHSDNAILAGSFQDTIDLGSGTLPAGAFSAIFVAKLAD